MIAYKHFKYIRMQMSMCICLYGRYSGMHKQGVEYGKTSGIALMQRLSLSLLLSAINQSIDQSIIITLRRTVGRIYRVDPVNLLYRQ